MPVDADLLCGQAANGEFFILSVLVLKFSL